MQDLVMVVVLVQDGALDRPRRSQEKTGHELINKP